jgi:hypothetical protein
VAGSEEGALSPLAGFLAAGLRRFGAGFSTTTPSDSTAEFFRGAAAFGFALEGLRAEFSGVWTNVLLSFSSPGKTDTPWADPMSGWDAFACVAGAGFSTAGCCCG